MEEANVSKRHSDAVLVAGINNMIVTDTTACFCYVFNTTLMSTLNIVAEWEESITTYRYTLVLGNPSLLLLAGQWLRLLCKELLPNAVLQYILPLIGDIDIDGIVAVGTTDLLLKGRFITLGHWRNHHSSALEPARRVQWIRLCWPAPIPIA